MRDHDTSRRRRAPIGGIRSFPAPRRFTCSSCLFYSALLTFAFVLSILPIVVFLATARGWQVVQRFRSWRRSGGLAEAFRLEPNVLMLPGANRSGFVRVIVLAWTGDSVPG